MNGHRPAGNIVKRSVAIAGHRTSISLEGPFWEALHRLARTRGRSVPSLVAEIDAGRGTANLSSAIRVYVLEAVSSPAREASQPPGGLGAD